MIRFSPDGKRLAVGSHDNFVDVYDTTQNRFQRLCRCTGHSSFVTHLDWSLPDPLRPEYRVRPPYGKRRSNERERFLGLACSAAGWKPAEVARMAVRSPECNVPRALHVRD